MPLNQRVLDLLADILFAADEIREMVEVEHGLASFEGFDGSLAEISSIGASGRGSIAGGSEAGCSGGASSDGAGAACREGSLSGESQGGSTALSCPRLSDGDWADYGRRVTRPRAMRRMQVATGWLPIARSEMIR